VAVAAVQPQAAEHAGVAAVRLPVAEYAGAAPDAAVAPQQAAEVGVWVAAAVPQPEEVAAASAGVAVRRRAAAGWDAAVVPRPEVAAPDVRAGQRREVRPLAVASAFRRDQVRPWPAPSPGARFGHAMERRAIALP
jgi:hypothetical protein